MRSTGQNIGFAIAIDAAKSTIQEAISHPSAPVAYLGVTTAPVTSDLQFQFNLPVDHGAYVVAVTPRGPAERAGIKNGDVIVAFDGKAVNSSDDLGNLIQQHKLAREHLIMVGDMDSDAAFAAGLGARYVDASTFFKSAQR